MNISTNQTFRGVGYAFVGLRQQKMIYEVHRVAGGDWYADVPQLAGAAPGWWLDPRQMSPPRVLSNLVAGGDDAVQMRGHVLHRTATHVLVSCGGLLVHARAPDLAEDTSQVTVLISQKK